MPTWKLSILEGPAEPSRDFPLDLHRTLVIGRAAEADLRLSSNNVSRRHAALTWAPAGDGHSGHWRLRDLGSTAGTIVNGALLQPHSEVRIEPEDRLEIKPYVLQVVSDQETRLGEHAARVSEDDADGRVQAATVAKPEALAQTFLLQLLAAGERMAAAHTDEQVARSAVSALVHATGFTNVGFLRPGAREGFIDVLASEGEIRDAKGNLLVSRSLLRRSREHVCVFSGEANTAATLNASLQYLDVQQAVSVPVLHSGVFYGWMYLDCRGQRGATHMDEAVSFASALGHFAALALANLARMRMQLRMDLEQREMFGGTMRALIAAIDAKDPYTRGHSDRVSAFSALLARKAGLGDHFIEMARTCGLVHDIGKIGVPEAVLRKPSRLDEDEFAFIKQHPDIGHAILMDIPQLREVLPGVRQHHERWDGKGYPFALGGDEISILGRVVGIADAFDAMTSARFYRPARQVQEVLDEVARCAGTHFDPELAKIFAAIPVAELAPLVAPPVSPTDPAAALKKPA